MFDPKEILSDVLARPKSAAFYELNRALRAAFPGHWIMQTEDWAFQLRDFAASGGCEIDVAEMPTFWDFGWDARDGEIGSSLEDGWLTVDWNGKRLLVLYTGIYADGSCRTTRSWIIADHEEDARAFFEAVCRWGSEVHGEVLVFSDGHWQKSEELYEAIKVTSLDSLILPAALKDEVRDNVHGFFGAAATYDRYRLPWKRGLLFLGPPGNGKTHMIKGLANELSVPCLYVRNFTAPYQTPHANIGNCFRRARDLAPCLMVLEDLDALVDDRNRSAFLNEMDGFYSNRGILTVATTNHPERLDPAILDRPSRFDRKFTFTLPGETARFRYLERQNEGLEAALRLSSEGLERAARETEGFSYAYLKELVLSAMMAWIREAGGHSMNEVLPDQIEALAGQMRTEAERPPEPEALDEDEYGVPRYWRR